MSTPTSNLAFVFPGGAVSSTTGVSLMPTPRGGSAQLPDGYQLASTKFQLAAQDSTGRPTLSFAQPAALTVYPTDSDLAMVGGDPTNLTLAQVNADNGAWEILQTTVNGDGSLSTSVNATGTFAILEPDSGSAGALA